MFFSQNNIKACYNKIGIDFCNFFYTFYVHHQFTTYEGIQYFKKKREQNTNGIKTIY